jgi:hypothetical protein
MVLKLIQICLEVNIYRCSVVYENSGECIVYWNSEDVESKNLKFFTTCMIPVLPGTSRKDLMRMIAPRFHVGM